MSGVRPGPEKIVVVSGDVTLDWNFARAKGSQHGLLSWDVDASFDLHMRPGGSALLAELLGKMAEGFLTKFRGHNRWRVVHADIAADATQQNEGSVHHSYAVWSLFKHDEKTPPERQDCYVWRVKDFLGLKRANDSSPLVERCWSQVAAEVANASLIILDDAALGFRQSPQVWGEALKRGNAEPWILLKMTRPVADGALWNYLHEHWADRLIVVVPVNDLRLTEARISRELSWERAAQDIVWELEYSPHLKKLSDCAHVVISFDTVGAVVVSRVSGARDGGAGVDPFERTLIFDPRSIEGMWVQDYPGGVIGYTICLVAGVARRCMLSSESPSIRDGVKDGLAAMQRLHRDGYGVKGVKDDEQPPLAFPLERVVEQLSSDNGALFADSPIEKPTRYLEQLFVGDGETGDARPWSILHEQGPEAAGAETSYLRNLAKRIVRLGPKAVLKSKPLGEFRKLLTADRQEVENYRSIRALIGEYSRQSNQERPLSIAVFGPPGSGKSFGITEVAESVLPGRVKKLTFNLSQLSSPNELFSALHQVRDVALSGSLPLVFWDEFDTSLDGRALGWLRYFLSPMQDGQFQQGEVTHPIGPAIFVFAGGTSETRERFGRGLNENKLKAAKVPDFISRLKGFVDILGPNPCEKDPARDPDYIIRRAILLRSFLEKYALHLFQPPDRKGRLLIDSGVLRAFLNIPHYKHGARSMESIVAMSFLTGKTRFERSALPSEAQLDLHVSGRTFLALVQQIMAGDYDPKDAEEATMKQRNDEIVELLAKAVHEQFCNERIAEGFVYGEVNNYDSEPKTHCSLKPFEQLPPDEQSQNRNNARDIPLKLASFNYAMTPARSNEPPFVFPPEELETLARKEHERWEREKRRAGWRYGPIKDPSKLEHPDLLPWAGLTREQLAGHEFYSDELTDLTGQELSEIAKRKDRETVEAIPLILARVGFTIVKIEDEPTELNRKVNESAEPKSESEPHSRGTR
jgi:hypothetical protein